jgi:Zn-dependent protease
MLRSWRLGSLFGIGIWIHSTFLLLPLFVVLSAEAAGVETILYMLALLAGVFGCVVLHELGHALMARRFGIRTVDITLYPIGGVARLERLPDKPSEELWIAVAGPAVNVVIAALLLPLVMGGGFLGQFLPLGPEGSFADVAWATGVRFLGTLLMANVVLVLFNLLPIFPMDGGRVLRALLAMRMGAVRATTVAVGVGRLFILGAMLLLLLFAPSYLLSSPSLILIAVFMLIVGQHELVAIRQREAMRQAAVAPLVPLSPLSSQGFGIEPGFSGVTWDERSRVGIQWHDGRPVGAFVVPSE